MESTQATSALKAWTSRKSRPDEPGTVRGTQVLPRSTVRRQVPADPLAHATSGPTTLMPRSRACVPLGCGCQGPSAAAAWGRLRTSGASHAREPLRRVGLRAIGDLLAFPG